MRDLRTNETAAVSGGTFGFLSLLFSKKQPVYCAPAPQPAPKCDPAPKCEPAPKPKKKSC